MTQLATRHPALLRRVYGCQACPERFGFSRPGADRPYYKFPPTIGAAGQADLLFVGINPRLGGNERLHERLMGSFEAFEDLAVNLDGRELYVRVGGMEPHYETHMEVVEGVFGVGAKFQDHAAVTELFFCASADTGGGLPENGSDCADEYLGEVFEQVQPKVVVCIGERVLGYFQTRFKSVHRRFRLETEGWRADVVWVPHPNDEHITDQGRKVCIGRAIEEIRAVLRP